MSYGQQGYGPPGGYQSEYGQPQGYDQQPPQYGYAPPPQPPPEGFPAGWGGYQYAEAGGADRELYTHATTNMSQYGSYDFQNAAQDDHRSVYGGERDRSGGAHLSHEILGGAAGFEAMRLFEQYQERHGKTNNHAFLKEIAVGFAVAEAVKLWENHNRQGGEAGRREVASRAAFTANSMFDQKYGGNSQGYGYPPQQEYTSPQPQMYPPPPPLQYGGYNQPPPQQYGYQPPPQQYGYEQPPPGQYYPPGPPPGPPGYPPY